MADAIAVLKAGRLEQTGKPLDLYRRPASRFVADFIGESNFIAGTIDSSTAQKTIMQTAVGKLESSAFTALAAGAKIIAAFRPESVAISRAGSTGPNALAGNIVQTTYLGEMAEHVVELANAQRIKAFEINPALSDGAGGPCVVTIPPENVMVVAEQETSGPC